MRARKRWFKIIIMVLLLIFLVGLALFMKEFFFPSEAKIIYGTRTKEIKKHKLTDETTNKVVEALKEEVDDIEVRVTGRLIYITMKVKTGTSVDTAKNLGTKTLESFTAEDKSYYDIQVLINSSEETTKFPIIGYKQHTREGFSWTKDRE